jgi:hypothetical protein
MTTAGPPEGQWPYPSPAPVSGSAHPPAGARAPVFGPPPPVLGVPVAAQAYPGAPVSAGGAAPPPVVFVPPEGPGVQPPFAAPPTERSRTRLWVGLALSIVLGVVCCVGGVIGLVATTAASTAEQTKLAVTTVDRFLGAIRDGRFSDAYKLTCSSYRDSHKVDDLRRSFTSPNIASYDIGDAKYGNPIEVSTTVHFESGRSERYTFKVVLDQESSELRICGVA